MRVTGAGRYIPHGVIRGDAKDLKENGAPWGAVASAGVRNSPAFRGYADLTADVGQGILDLSRWVLIRKMIASWANGLQIIGVPRWKSP